MNDLDDLDTLDDLFHDRLRSALAEIAASHQPRRRTVSIAPPTRRRPVVLALAAAAVVAIGVGGLVLVTGRRSPTVDPVSTDAIADDLDAAGFRFDQPVPDDQVPLLDPAPSERVQLFDGFPGESLWLRGITGFRSAITEVDGRDVSVVIVDLTAPVSALDQLPPIEGEDGMFDATERGGEPAIALERSDSVDGSTIRIVAGAAESTADASRGPSAELIAAATEIGAGTLSTGRAGDSYVGPAVVDASPTVTYDAGPTEAGVSLTVQTLAEPLRLDADDLEAIYAGLEFTPKGPHRWLAPATTSNPWAILVEQISPTQLLTIHADDGEPHELETLADRVTFDPAPTGPDVIQNPLPPEGREVVWRGEATWGRIEVVSQDGPNELTRCFTIGATEWLGAAAERSEPTCLPVDAGPEFLCVALGDADPATFVGVAFTDPERVVVDSPGDGRATVEATDDGVMIHWTVDGPAPGPSSTPGVAIDDGPVQRC